MYLTGFADEAAEDIDGQIRATKELGWENIESRGIGGRNIHDISDADFDKVCEKLGASGVKVNCFGSAIANWGKSILDPFDITVQEIRRAIPRMKRLGTKLIRIMSYAVLKDRAPDKQEEQERFKRLRDILKMFNAEGITPVHENCMNYGGMGWTFTARLIENVPGLKLCFDTGNPVFSDDMSAKPPYPKQSAWQFYSHVKDHVAYVHIKDGIFDHDGNRISYTYPGEGHGDVRKILKDLLSRGYDGGISIEPHMRAVFHDASVKSEAEAKHRTYVEYGRRLMKLIDSVKKEI